jgi:hypothetical protein
MAYRRLAAASLLVILTVSCGGGDSAGAEGFCNAARDLAGITPGDLDRTLSTMERLRAEAPDEIKDSVNILADAAKEASESRDPKIAQRQEVLDASDDLDAYLQDNCEAPK